MAEAQIHETRAFVAERRQQFEEAERRHRAAMKLRGAASADSTLHAKSREYVARAILAQGRADEASELLAPLASRLGAGAKGYFTHLEDALLAVVAGEGRWDDWDTHIDAAFRFDEFPPTTVHIRALTMAARLARDAGQYTLARDAYDRLLPLLEERRSDAELLKKLRRERAAIEERQDVLATTVGPPAADVMEDSGTFSAPHTEEHTEVSEDRSAPFLEADDLVEDSDPIDEPDFTGRVQVLSLPVDPADENFGQFGFDSETDDSEDDVGFAAESFAVFRVADLRREVFEEEPPPDDQAETHEMDAPKIKRPPRNAAADLPGDVADDLAELDELALPAQSHAEDEHD
jgi:hypothetical protein